MLPALAAVNGKQQSPQPGRFQVPAGRGLFFAVGSPQRGRWRKGSSDDGLRNAQVRCFLCAGTQGGRTGCSSPFRRFPETTKKDEVLRSHKTSSLVRWKGLSRALADSPQDCPPRPGRRAAGRAVRVPSRDFRKRQKKKRFLVSLEPLLWCAGRDSNPRPSDS